MARKFASGNEVASFVTSSRLLCRSWSAISSSSSSSEETVGIGLSWKVSTEWNDSNMTIIIAFKATINSSDINADLVSSSVLRVENFLQFEFLCSVRYPHFSLNKTAVSLFRQNDLDLDKLKSEISSYIPVARIIVTGHGIGGAVASLFTISLLPSIGSHKKRLLCITFGSPLIGDKKLQQAISCSSNWNSCFLHVVSHRDPLPSLFITNRTSAYMPFGTSMVCSYATSFEDPESVLEIFMALGSIHDPSQEFQSIDYGNIVENLYHKAIVKDFSSEFENKSYPDSLATGISLQLRALGLTPHMQQNRTINILETKLKELEEKWISQKRISFDASKELNEMKICMAQLEWFKKTAKDQDIGYYDCYKNKYSSSDLDVVKFHKMLTTYWEKMVEEAEMMPQKEGAAFRKRWLVAGTNYRRMVEPLAIAQYYGDGGKDYVNKQRSKHFKLLEEWLLKEGTTEATSFLDITQMENVEAVLTIDSCFWAHVEEAIHSCSREFKNIKGKWVWDEEERVLEFEAYVYGLTKDYAVSPEIFLAQSSYMKWWNQYSEIMGYSYTSPLVNFMTDGRGSYARDFEHWQERKLYRASDYGWKMFRYGQTGRLSRTSEYGHTGRVSSSRTPETPEYGKTLRLPTITKSLFRQERRSK